MNMLDASLRCEPNLVQLKTGLKEWVKENIAAKPKSRFQAISSRPARQAPPDTAPSTPTLSVNLITRYFQPVSE